jgi:hypothetical protein
MSVPSTYLGVRHNAKCGSGLNKKGIGSTRKEKSGIENPTPALQPSFDKEDRYAN